MMQVSTKELRTRTRAIMEAVARGEEVVVTYRGKAQARILPMEERKVTTETPLFGIWKDNEESRNVEAYIDKLRRRRY